MSQSYFAKVQAILADLDLEIVEENADQTLFIVADEDRGIANLVIDCEDELLVLEQLILPTAPADGAGCKRLLQMNRDLVHGAFAVDDENRVVFRDTLQIANLDPNELEASINALALGLAAFAEELIAFSKAA